MVPDSQELHTPSPAPSSHVEVPKTVYDHRLTGPTAPLGDGIDGPALALALVACVASRRSRVVPRVEGATAPLTHGLITEALPPPPPPPPPPSDLDRILMAIAGISAKVDGVDSKVGALSARVTSLEQNDSFDYGGLGEGPLPSFDYNAMPVDLEEAVAQVDEDEWSHILDEDDEVLSLFYANIVPGAVYGDAHVNFPPPPHPDIDQAYFSCVASSWADERQLSLCVLDPAGRADLSKHFWKVFRAEQTTRPARPSAPHVACTTGDGTVEAPIEVDSSSDPSPSQQARDAHTIIFDCDDTRPAPTTAPAAWTSVSRRRNTPSANPPSFASVAAKAAPPLATLPVSVAQATAGLSRDDLLGMTAGQVRSAYLLRFGGCLGRHHTKAGVVEAYLSKVRSESSSAPKPSPPPKILQLTEFTVVRDPDSFGLKAHNCVDNLGRRCDAASVVRQLQSLIRSALPPQAHPRAELIGGRWSSQPSSNFLLTFGGQLSNDNVLSL